MKLEKARERPYCLIVGSAFCSWVDSDVSGLVEEMQNVTGRSSDWEAFAWERSLPKLPILLGPIASLRTPQRLFRLFLRVICLSWPLAQGNATS